MKNIAILISSILLSTIVSSAAQAVESQNESQMEQNFLKTLFETQGDVGTFCPSWPSCPLAQSKIPKESLIRKAKDNSEESE